MTTDWLLYDERDELVARIEALRDRQYYLFLILPSATSHDQIDRVSEAFDAIGDELGKLQQRLDEIEEELGWEEYREERRNAPIW